MLLASSFSLFFCESLRILAMSRRTRNSRDAGLFPEVTPAVLPEVSVQSSQPAAAINPSVASPLPSAELSPDCYDCTGGVSFLCGRINSCFALAIGFVARQRRSAGISCSSLPLPGGVPGQDLSAQASALPASGTGFSLQSSLALTLSSSGRPAFVVPSLYLRLRPQILRLYPLERVELPPFPLSLVCRHLSPLIQRQFFIIHLWSARDSRRSQQKSSPSG